MIVAIIVGVAPIVAISLLIVANIRRLAPTRSQDEPPQRLPGPPRTDFGGGGGPSSVRVPRRPLLPVGSATAALEEPEPDPGGITEVRSLRVQPRPTRDLRAS